MSVIVVACSFRDTYVKIINCASKLFLFIHSCLGKSLIKFDINTIIMNYMNDEIHPHKVMSTLKYMVTIQRNNTLILSLHLDKETYFYVIEK